MKSLYKLLISLFMILPLAENAAAQTTLRDVLSSEGCGIACYMGIEPGITTQSELEKELDELNIDYDLSVIGSAGLITTYSFYPDSLSPFIMDGSAVSVTLGGDQVEEIFLRLSDVAVVDILEWYGAPAKITGVWENENYNLVYPDDGLVFSISQDNPSVIEFVLLRTRSGVVGTFMDRSELRACTEPASLCNISTATPPPAATETPPPSDTPTFTPTFPPPHTPTNTPTRTPTPTFTPLPAVGTLQLAGVPATLTITSAWTQYSMTLSQPPVPSERVVRVQISLIGVAPSSGVELQVQPPGGSWTTTTTFNITQANWNQPFNIRIRGLGGGDDGRIVHRVTSGFQFPPTTNFPVNTIDAATGRRLTGAFWTGGNDMAAATDSRNVILFTLP